ncbi:hypothetical protein ACFL9U_10220, partial [Thermodesulfobacteriota bacterium]
MQYQKNPTFLFILAAVSCFVFLCCVSGAHAWWLSQFDTDGDGVFDTVEVDKGTSPSNPDTDGDGVGDLWEIGVPLDWEQTYWGGRYALVIRYWNEDDPQLFASATDHLGTFRGRAAGPANPDPEWFYEYQEALSPFLRDSDGDGLSDGKELSFKLGEDMPTDIEGNHYGDWLIFDPTHPDSDLDGVPDSVEYAMGLHHFDYTQTDRWKDFDGDNLTDYQEIYVYGTDPFSPDTDGDEIEDFTEIYWSPPLDPRNPDTDGDGYKDGQEGPGRLYDTVTFTPEGWGGPIYYSHDPAKSFLDDTDGDGLSDMIEMEGRGDYQDTDSDDDNLSDLDEKGLNTDPFKWSTDGDTMSDGEEVAWGTNPLIPDMDGDELDDGEEFDYNTDPRNSDTDGDGLSDADEIWSYSTDPVKPDTDADGLNDGQEISLGTYPNNPDTDNDTLWDGREIQYGTDPNYWDTDWDGLSDSQEVQNGLDPLAADADEDNFDDSDELKYGTDPNVADVDGDGLNDSQEYTLRTNPFSADTDGDSISDGADSNPTYNDVDEVSVSYSWSDNAVGYMEINGPSSIRADGATSADYTVTVYGGETAGRSVSVSIDEPGDVVGLTEGGVTNVSGEYIFRYTPARSQYGTTFAAITVTSGPLSLAGNIYLTAPGIDVETVAMPHASPGIAGKFEFKVKDDMGDPISGPTISFDIVDGKVSYSAKSATEYLGEWTPTQKGIFPLQISVSWGGSTGGATMTARSGVSPLGNILEQTAPFLTRLELYYPSAVDDIKQAMDTITEAYYQAEKEDRSPIQNQAEALFQITRTFVGICEEAKLVADSGAALLLPAFSLDFALDYVYGKLAGAPGISGLISRAKSLSDSVFSTLYTKLGASAQVDTILSAARSKMEATVSASVKGTPGSAIKVNLEKAVNQQMKDLTAQAIVKGVMDLSGFAADISQIQSGPISYITSWRNDSINRLAEVRQIALDNTRSEGAMSTIAATADGVGEAANLIAAGLAATGVGAAPAALISAVKTAVSSMTFMAKAATGANYGITLSRMAVLGVSGSSTLSLERHALAYTEQQTPSSVITWPESLD